MPDGAYARNEDPLTSHEAAAQVNVNNLEGIVVDTLLRNPEGLTVDELSEVTGIRDKSISPRMKPLEKKELVWRNGKRKNVRNCNQIVWMHHSFFVAAEPAEAPPVSITGEQTDLFGS
jgi:DNA-binding transcriptional regulator GbsR (MarR family)